MAIAQAFQRSVLGHTDTRGLLGPKQLTHLGGPRSGTPTPPRTGLGSCRPHTHTHIHMTDTITVRPWSEVALAQYAHRTQCSLVFPKTIVGQNTPNEHCRRGSQSKGQAEPPSLLARLAGSHYLTRPWPQAPHSPEGVSHVAHGHVRRLVVCSGCRTCVRPGGDQRHMRIQRLRTRRAMTAPLATQTPWLPRTLSPHTAATPASPPAARSPPRTHTSAATPCPTHPCTWSAWAPPPR